jgi:hypothetical protein
VLQVVSLNMVHPTAELPGERVPFPTQRVPSVYG